MVYFSVPRSFGNTVLFVFSLIFYIIGEGWNVWILFFSIFVNYLFALCIDFFRASRIYSSKFNVSFILWIAVFSNIIILGYFKYADFFAENINELYRTLGGGPSDLISLGKIALPLGVSFFTFQSLSYVFDVYYGNARAAKNPLMVATYIALFPKLVVGPIVRYSEIERDLSQRRVDLAGFVEGVYRFAIGLAEKLFLAGPAGQLADQVFSMPSNQLDVVSSWWGVVWYTLQIYFDFSAYSNMAIGLGRMFGFHFPENFNYPYISRSIKEFWRRWHITLSRWFRDYVYIPAGGNRKGALRMYSNLLLVFLLTGFWHGAAWNFIIWGLWHGLFLVLERVFSRKIGDDGTTAKCAWLADLSAWIYTILVVMTGWVMFRCETMLQAFDFFRAMSGSGVPVSDLSFITFPRMFLLVCCLLFASPVLDKWAFPLRENFSLFKLIVAVTCLVLSLPLILSSGYSPFVYFRF
jgi:alginate O-acetyltransferase complex protein AlgI